MIFFGFFFSVLATSYSCVILSINRRKRLPLFN